VILASWAGTLGWLTWRVYHRGGSAFMTGSAPILPPDAYFFTVRAAGNQVGVSSITVDTLADGVQITDRLGLDLPLHPTSPRSQFTSQYTIGADLRLRRFRITLPGRTDPIVQEGTVEGDSIITVTNGTGEPRLRLDVRGRSLIPPLAAAVTLARQGNLKRGFRAEVPVFDPRTLKPRVISLAVLGDSTFEVPDSADFDSLAGIWIAAHSDTLLAWRLAWSDGRQSSQVWVDTRGLPIQSNSAAGLTLDRSAFEIVNINYRRRRASQPMVRAGGVIPRTVIAAGLMPDQGIEGMRVSLRTWRGNWALPVDTLAAAVQFMDGDVIVLHRGTFIPSASGAVDSTLDRWLGDEPLLGIHDSSISRRARAIVGTGSDPWQTASRLVAWVSGNIAPWPDPVIPRAATVLREGRADVDGHTLLFVALARASGLPARTVNGILLAGGKFYLHSWAEVYLDRWVPVDPTWGELPAQANRVRMATDALARPLDLLPLVAGLDAELLTLTQRP
jgi:hypothetical protein